MPVKPKPRTYVCQACGWKKIVAPRSDVLMPDDVVSVCPKCRSNQIVSREPTLVESLTVNFLGNS